MPGVSAGGAEPAAVQVGAHVAPVRAAPARAARGRGEDGNTLLLFPFAVLVLLALGGIALDAAVAFQADRRAVDEASALANDIAGVVDAGSFFATGGDDVTIDPAFAARATAAANARLGPDLSCAHQLAGDAVTVTCTGTARPIIMPALGGITTFDVGGTVTTFAVRGTG